MASRKNMSGKDDGRQVRGKSGPPSSTANEEGRAGKRQKKGERAARRVPKIGKRETGRGDSTGGELH